MSGELVYAGIVTFNSDINQLKRNIDAVIFQVDRVIIFDNGSGNQAELHEFINHYEGLELICSAQNLGIAAALNQLMQWGNEHQYRWMLSLDQDSICGRGFVSALLPFFKLEPNIGIAAPVIVDKSIGIVGHIPQKSYEYVKTCITSGAIVDIGCWEKIGKYDESMFIDSVDFEFCYRMRKYGYSVIQVKDVKLAHELGKSCKRKFLIWKVDVTGHTAFRKYYIARNNIYYPLKHHLPLHFLRGNFRNIWLIIIVLFYEDEKKEKIASIISGWRNAYKRIK